MFRIALFISALLSGCGYVNYNELPKDGYFKGTVLVMWVGENTTGLGSGEFVFVPAPGDPLRFVRADGIEGATVQTIEPGMIYTDGGSIPRPIQLFNGFSPWGYAPAYMIHDWLFVARHCLTDGQAKGNETDIAAMKFNESAEIIGEAIKALIRTNQVQQNDIAPTAISSAVAGPISYKRWVAKGACDGDRIDPDHAKQVKAALTPTVQPLVLGRRKAQPPQPRDGVAPARIVSQISF